MTFDLAHIWASMSLANKVITMLIALMGLFVIAICFERMVALRKSAQASRAFALHVDVALREWDLDRVVELCHQHPASSVARLFRSLVLKYADVAPQEPPFDGAKASRTDPIDLVRNESARQLEILGAELRRGMPVLATIGSITPFVGLLGTVIGIIAAFTAIGESGTGGLSTVSTGIAEALIETAFGLAVAIPAVMAFNYLTSRISAVESALSRCASELIDELDRHHVRPARLSRARDTTQEQEAHHGHEYRREHEAFAISA